MKNVDYATVQLKVPDAITWGEEEVSNIWVSNDTSFGSSLCINCNIGYEYVISCYLSILSDSTRE